MDNAREWHLDKTVSWGHILTTISLVMSGLYFFFDIKEDVAVMGATYQQEIEHVKELQDQQNKNIDEKIDDIKEDLKEILKELKEQRESN